jgi:hypothetical protein
VTRSAPRTGREPRRAVTPPSRRVPIEIFVIDRILPSAAHPEERLPGGPRDPAASRRSFQFGLQFSDGGKAAGRPGGGRPDYESEPTGPVLYPFAGGGGPHSFISRWWTWPLPPAGAAGVRLRVAAVRYCRRPARPEVERAT